MSTTFTHPCRTHASFQLKGKKISIQMSHTLYRVLRTISMCRSSKSCSETHSWKKTAAREEYTTTQRSAKGCHDNINQLTTVLIKRLPATQYYKKVTTKYKSRKRTTTRPQEILNQAIGVDKLQTTCDIQNTSQHNIALCLCMYLRGLDHTLKETVSCQSLT